MKRLMAIGLLWAGTATAQDVSDDLTGKSLQDLQSRVIESYCRDGDGVRQELGAVVCITASCDTWMAKCEKFENVTIWRRIQDGCPGADGSILNRLRVLSPPVSSPGQSLPQPARRTG